jgi:hypothetical protein
MNPKKKKDDAQQDRQAHLCLPYEEIRRPINAVTNKKEKWGFDITLPENTP